VDTGGSLRSAIIVVSTARCMRACCKARFDFKARCVTSLIQLARFFENPPRAGHPGIYQPE
jgi:hypothetical protein